MSSLKPPTAEFGSSATDTTSQPDLSPIAPLSESEPVISHHPMTTKLQDGTRRPKTFPNYKLYFSTKHPLMALHSHVPSSDLPSTPTRFSQAVRSPHWRCCEF
jgi:hypothetical protein